MKHEARCKTCQWYAKGTCRYNPPMVIAANHGYFPKMNPDEWCRRYHPIGAEFAPGLGSPDTIVYPYEHGQVPAKVDHIDG